MKTFKVGGYVRDTLLNKEVSDIDYVVVGGTEEEMLALGFERVGADFPVFLHPQTKEEYALARQERKNSTGYLGFEVTTQGVTLEQDLSRRDLTINAMAIDDAGVLHDPFNGKDDIENKIIRHVGPAFAEDPVRVLRIGRFLAKLPGQWTVAPETFALIEEMKANGLLDELVGERVWKELFRGLQEDQSLKMLSFFKKIDLFNCKSLKGKLSLNEEVFEISQELFEKQSVETQFCLAFELEDEKLNWVPNQFKESYKTLKVLESLKSFDNLAIINLLDKTDFFKSKTNFKTAVNCLYFTDPIIYEALLEPAHALSSFSTKNLDLSNLPAVEIRKKIVEEKLRLMQ